MEMTYEDVTISGATHPGIPFHMFGKTPYMTWAITSALTDLSDLYREKLSDDKKQYFVDGKWKDLKIIKEKIFVKGQDEPEEFEIKLTHRGPLVDLALLQGAEVLFSEGLPQSKDDTSVFSFAWSGAIGQEGTMKIIRDMIRCKTMKEFEK
jgi:acyl-homoserine lactone acylase PvdQ